MARERMQSSGGAFRVTVNDKVLVHLLDFANLRDAGEVPADITQPGIAEVVNARRSHVSAAIATLRGRGLLEEHLARVTDQVRRRKAYFLTAKGYEEARKLVEGFRARTVRVSVDGAEREVGIADLPDVLGERYFLVDVLCSVRRDGTLDLATLTGQPEKGPPPPAPPPPLPPTTRRALLACPRCRSPLEVPYAAETALFVLCGACGLTFQASIGTPMRQATVERLAPSTSEKTRRGEPAALLAITFALSAAASVALFTPLLVVACALFLPAVLLAAIALPSLRRHEALPIAVLGISMLLLAPAVLLAGSLAGVGLAVGSSAVFAAALAAVAVRSLGRKMAIGASFAIAAGLAPLAGGLGLMVGAGLLLAAGGLLTVVFRGAVREEASRPSFVAAGFGAAVGAVTYLRWTLAPTWDLLALGTMALVVGSVYAFAGIARPIALKTRANVAAALGTFLIALAGYIVVAPTPSGWAYADAPYFLLFGAGAVYFATRIHRPETLWPLACLGAGVFVLTASAVTLATHAASLPVAAVAALIAWAAVGAAVAWAKFAGPLQPAHLLAVRAGLIAAVAGVLLAAGAHLIYAGRGIEGIVELTLGVPVLGFALLRSGAPWIPRLAVSGLFLATVFASWLALFSA